MSDHERERRASEAWGARPAPARPGDEGDPVGWLRDGPTLVRRLVMAEVLGPPRALQHRRGFRVLRRG